MTQEFVTLPREVVERALASLESEFGKHSKSASDIRATLEQPQAEQPAMTPIAQRKLDSLLAEGYTISGYSIYHEQKHQHGFVTGAGLVGWWRPKGMEHVQPLGEQEQVGEAAFMPGTTGFTMACFLASDVPVGTKLYTHPQPKRKPLTHEQIAAATGAKPGTPMWLVAVACTRAIEAAHNIK